MEGTIKYEIWKEVIECEAEIGDAVVLDIQYPTGGEELVAEFELLSDAQEYFEEHCRTAIIEYKEYGTAVATVWWLEKMEVGDGYETCIDWIAQSDIE